MSKLADILSLFVVMFGTFVGGFMVGAYLDYECDDNPSIYIKCHEVALFVELQEEDMGSSTELPKMLRLRCQELQDG